MASEQQGDDRGQSAERTPTAPRGLTKQALGGMFWTFGGTGLQMVVQLLAMMALGRLLTPTEFGLMGAAQVVIAVSQIVSQLGVGQAIIQRKDLSPTHVRVAVTLSGVLGLSLGAVVWLGASAIATFYRIPALEPILHGVALLFPVDGLNTVARSILVRQLRFRLFVTLEVATYIVGYALVAVILAWAGLGVWALVVANLSQTTLRMVAMYLVTRHPLRPSLDRRARRDLLAFGVGHSLAQIGMVFSEQGDNVVVGRWLGPAALGVYGRAYSMMIMPATSFGRIVNRVLFPIMAQVQDERDRLAGAYERALAIVALVSVPLASFLWIVAPEVVPLVLGPGWADVVVPFRMFSLSLPFRMSSQISDVCAKAAGAVYSRALVQTAFAALVVLGALLGQQWGVQGVAVAVSSAMIANWLGMAQLSRRVTGLSWSSFARAHVPGLLIAAPIGGAVMVVLRATRASQLGNLPSLVAAGLTLAATIYAVLRLRPERFLGPHGTWAFHRATEVLQRCVITVIGRRTSQAKS